MTALADSHPNERISARREVGVGVGRTSQTCFKAVRTTGDSAQDTALC